MTLNCVSIYLLRLIGLWQTDDPTDRQTRDDSIYIPRDHSSHAKRP